MKEEIEELLTELLEDSDSEMQTTRDKLLILFEKYKNEII